MKTRSRMRQCRQNRRGAETDRSAINGMLVVEDPIEHGRIRENDKAEASGTAGGLVAHDDGLGDVAVLVEVFGELLLCGVPC